MRAGEILPPDRLAGTPAGSSASGETRREWACDGWTKATMAHHPHPREERNASRRFRRPRHIAALPSGSTSGPRPFHRYPVDQGASRRVKAEAGCKAWRPVKRDRRVVRGRLRARWSREPRERTQPWLRGALESVCKAQQRRRRRSTLPPRRVRASGSGAIGRRDRFAPRIEAEWPRRRRRLGLREPGARACPRGRRIERIWSTEVLRPATWSLFRAIEFGHSMCGCTTKGTSIIP